MNKVKVTMNARVVSVPLGKVVREETYECIVSPEPYYLKDPTLLKIRCECLAKLNYVVYLRKHHPEELNYGGAADLSTSLDFISSDVKIEVLPEYIFK